MQRGTLIVLLLVIMGSNIYAQVVDLQTTQSPGLGTTVPFAEANATTIPVTPNCNSSQDCLSCSDIPGCGWCDVTQECLTGTEFGASNVTCSSWFYYGCFSAGDTASCSEHIADMSCDATHCDETKTNYNADVCEHCRTVEECFDQENPTDCPSWNEAKCPEGLPAQNDSIPHKNVVQIADNVKVVDPIETTLYNCPVVFPLDVGDGAALLVAPTPTGFEVGDAIVSGQAGGIMHNVDSITPYGPYAFVMASAANMEDVVPYVNFQGAVDAVPIEDEATVEHTPDGSLFFGALNGEFQNYSTIHVVQEDVSVYKCVGEKYISGNGDEWASTFFVMKKTDFDGFSVDIDDIIVGNYSLGWLETITEISSNDDPEFLYVRTKLVNCADMLPDESRLKLADESQLEDNIPDLHCEGGDNSDGLMVYKDMSAEDFDYQVGDTIVGKGSGPFMSQVMSWTEVGEFVFIEASPVSELNDTSTMNSTSLERRRRDLFVGVSFRLERGFSASVRGKGKNSKGVTVSGRASISVVPYVYLRAGLQLSLDWGWSSPYVSRAEAKFVGQAGLGIKASASISGSLSYTWKKTLAEGVIKKVCLPIISALCLPGKVKYAIKAQVKISAKISAKVGVHARADARATLGAVWKRGAGLTPIFESNLKFKAGTDASSEVEGEAGIKATVTPSVTLDLPSPGLPINLPWWIKRLLPKWLRGSSSTSRSAITLFSPTVSMPLMAEVEAEFCPALKEIEYSYGLPALKAKVKIGIKNFLVNVALQIGLPFTGGDKMEYDVCSTTAPPTTTAAPPTTTAAPPTTTAAPPTTTAAPPTTTAAPPTTTAAPPTTTPLKITTTPFESTTTPLETTTAPHETTIWDSSTLSTSPSVTVRTTPYGTTIRDRFDTTPSTKTDAPETTESFGTTPSPDIPCIADLVFLLDESWSIGRAKFEEAKRYIRDVVKCLNITDARVGVTRFDCEAKWAIPLGKYADAMQLQDSIMEDVIFEGGDRSRVGSAIYHMMCTASFRDNARKVAVVMTDGRFGGRYVGRAQEARDDGIELYGTAVGRRAFIRMSGLTAITGNPARVVQWRQVDPCVFAATLCNSG